MGAHLLPGIQAIYTELATRRFRSLAEANAFLQRRMDEYNATPQGELGGLSPAQMHELLGGDWKTEGALRLQPLAPDAAGGTAFVANAQALLRAGAVKAGLKATATESVQRAGGATKSIVCRSLRR